MVRCDASPFGKQPTDILVLASRGQPWPSHHKTWRELRFFFVSIHFFLALTQHFALICIIAKVKSAKVARTVCTLTPLTQPHAR
jgi:hypothetical protein